MSNIQASSGVRNLRARFEGNKDSISPPSRGRSPTGSETSNTGPRPLSKVRTSFVAVERSGQMAPQLGLKKPSNNGEHEAGGTGGDKSQVAPDSEQAKRGTVKTGNGNGHLGQEAKTTAIGEETIGGSSNDSHDETSRPLLKESGPTENTSSRDLDKLSLSSEEPTAPKLTSAPGPETKTTEAAPLEEAEGLGSLLKGSAFEPSPAEKQKSEPSKTSQELEPVLVPVKSKRATSPVHGKTAHIKNPSKPVPTKVGSAHPRPLAISTSRETTTTKPSSKSSKPSSATSVVKSPTTPVAPKTPVTPQRHPSSKTTSPRQQVTPKEASKAPLRKSSRPSMASTNTTAQAAKTRQPAPPASSNNVSNNVLKKAPKTSPESKIRPKSPTRPVRLPASATAPTAASAANLGGTPARPTPPNARVTAPPVNTTGLGRKPSTLKRDTKPSTSRVTGPPASTLHKKPSRPSLPLQNGHERPKSRVSNVGSKAPDEGFLARMMRPTASSARKTHEKIEPKTPPKKTAAVKPKIKRDSIGGDGKRGGGVEDHEHVHQRNGHSDTTSSSIPEHEAEPSEEPVNQAAGNEIAV